MRLKQKYVDRNNSFYSSIYPPNFVRGSFVINRIIIEENNIRGYATMFYLGKYRGGDIEHFPIKGIIQGGTISLRTKLRGAIFDVKLVKREGGKNIWEGSYNLSCPHDAGQIICKVDL
jgi:hypothetical protein